MLNRRDWHSYTALIVFAVCTLQQPGLAADGGSKSLSAALFAAIRSQKLPAVKHLLHRGASPSARENLLTKPSLRSHDPGSKPELGDTPLMAATGDGNVELMRLLISAGANVNGAGQAEFTPLISATQRGNLRAVNLLLTRGASPDQRNDYGDTALLFAGNGGFVEIIRALLQHGANVDGGAGRTPLMEAAESGSKEAVALLLHKKANLDTRRGSSLNALEYARLGWNDDIVNMLVRAGAKGRSKEELHRDIERETREYERKHDQPGAATTQQSLTEEDQIVLKLILLDLLARRDKDVPLLEAKGGQIDLADTTAKGPGLLSDDQMNADLDIPQANDVSLEIRADLVRRNEAPCSLSSFQPDKQIALRAEADRASARTRRWAQVYLPGYNKAKDRAVVRMWIGPSPHGGSGTYHLVKDAGGWRIRWRHFAFYA